MPAIDYRAARSQIRLAEVLDLLDFRPCQRCADQVRGRCPVHESRSARSRSFTAHLGKRVWHCFTCGASGNALDLWVAVTRQPVYAAVLDLYTRLGRDVPWLPAASHQVYQREKSTMPEP
jgi:DNA primase